jgi:hypothetical protein
MGFFELLAQIIELLQREQRVSYRALKREFSLDDAYLEDVKVELIEVKQLAVDHEGKMLLWTGDPASSSTPAPCHRRHWPATRNGSLFPTPRSIWSRKSCSPVRTSKASASRSPSCSPTSKIPPN